MALLMAGFCPEYFKAVGAFVPISDLALWAEQSAEYRRHVLACCSSSKEEMLLRSPVSYVDTIVKANLKIFHGKTDPIVPFTQSLTMYQLLLEKDPKARVYLDIFDGRHELDLDAAGKWFMSQYKDHKMTQVTG